MPENDNKIIYYALVSVIIAFLLICLIYFSVIIHFIKQNYYKHITNLWADYCITVSIGIIFTLLYLISLLKYKTKRSIKLEDLYSNILLISVQSTLLLFFYSTINNSIFDILESFTIISKIVKFKKVNNEDLQEITEKFREIDIMNNKENKHHCFIIIINIINLLLVSFFIIIYRNINIQRNIFSIKHYIYLLQYYHILVLIILIVCILIMSIFKKSLFENKCRINKKFVKKIYNIYLNQIVYYIDILLFKICIDLFVNIPITFYYSFSMFTDFSIIILELSIFIFIFIGANLLLTIDNNNNYKNKGHRNKIITSKILTILFYLIDSRFNNYAYSLFLGDYEYFIKCSIEKKNILSELSINFIDKNLINYNENQEYNLDEVKEIDSQVKEEDNDDNINKSGDNSEIDIMPEYFIIYKLLYIFFDRNKENYKKLKKNSSIIRQYSIESNSSGKKTNKKRSKRQKEQENNNNMEEFLLNVEKVSRLSELESRNLTSFLKLKKENIFNSIQEKDYLEEINKKYKKSKKSNINFIIEALSISPLFEIFPFYQIKIEDILKSLNPQNNIENFKKFLNKSNINNESEKISNCGSDKKSNNENIKSGSNESGKNTNNENNKNQININSESKKGKDNTFNNESESENKSSESSELNCYSSYNYLLMMEIYNRTDFINYHEISELTSSFKNYAIKLVQKMKYTFLPLLIGIFNIKFLGKNKIIILYRNPLYFSISADSRFSHCSNFPIENAEKPKKSKNSIIDIKETEKDNIKVNDADYEEILT